MSTDERRNGAAENTKGPVMASYKQAIEWMVDNDDTEWVEADPHSVTAALVADLFGKTDIQVRLDIIKALVKAGRLPKGTQPHANIVAEAEQDRPHGVGGLYPEPPNAA